MNRTVTMPSRHKKMETRGWLHRSPKSVNVAKAVRYSSAAGKGRVHAKSRAARPLRVVRGLMWLWRLALVSARVTLWVRQRRRVAAPRPVQPVISLPVAGGAAALGFAAGFGIAKLTRKEASGPPPMPHLDVWREQLIKEHGDIEGAMLAVRLQTRYDELYAHRPRFDEKALQRHLELHILPGIALYGLLHQEHRDRKSTLEDVSRYFEVAFMGQRPLVGMLKYVPAPFFALRKAVLWQLKRDFPPQGWTIDVQEDNDRILDFHVRRCFYLNVLRAYGVPELTSLYCKNDDLLFKDLPAGIIWERTRTLGRGDAVCDFRWCNAAPKAITHYETAATNTHAPAPEPVSAK